jgi:tripartite-type tricarboxylate transporter receptor subunit TctC
MTWLRSASLGIVALLAGELAAAAQTPADPTPVWPNQAVRIIVPFGAGSVTDGLARVLADKLGETWQQQVIVDNRPGIAGIASAAKAAPDGYTLVLNSNGHTVAGVFNKSLPFDPVKDFAGVTQVASIPLVFVTPATLPATTLQEFIALAKEKPGTLNFASAGLASTAYLAAEIFKQTAKIDIVHVPYKGAPDAMTGLIRGDSHLYLLAANLTVELKQTGKVRALAVATPARSAALPDVPTVAEAGLPDYKYDAWFGVMAPAGTPRAVLDKISRDIARALQVPEIRERLTRQGVGVVASTPDQFDTLIKADTERYGRILKEAGVGTN